MTVLERLLKYVQVHTTSDESTGTTPSTNIQFNLANLLVEEMKEIGVEGACVDDKCYVYGFIPATPGYENRTKLGFIAHLDTAPDYSGEHVKPIIHENYDGEDIVLGDSGNVIKVSDFPYLKEMKGRSIVTSDGTTLLGADDKAGIAIIMTMAETIIKENIPHGKICLGFTPDEEIGSGAADLDLEKFGADYAFTMDGDLEDEINYETFNAASATYVVHGVNVHPGSAKDIMKNAALIATELANKFPKNETPATTEKYEGFYHMTSFTGNVENAKVNYIVRDHDATKFDERKAFCQKVAEEINAVYGAGTVTVELKEQYRNMKEVLESCMFLIDNVKTAMKNRDVSPRIEPIRGGTDGARLSLRGLPCPNIGTGGGGYHGPMEHVSVEGMEKSVEVLVELLQIIE